MPSRREFVQSAIVTTAFGVLPRRAAAPAAPPRIRVAVLMEPGFPAIDVSPLRPDAIGAAVDGFDTTYLAVGELADRLTPERFDVYVTPFGSALPKEAWPTLLRYLGGAGNWVNIGGVPCAVPVVRSVGGWKPEARQTEYHHRLGVTLACPVAAAAVTAWRADESLPWTSALSATVPGGAATVWELYYRLSSVADTPEESGSAGPREAVVRPLLSGYDADARAIAAPFVMLDRLEREFAGGRWIFATSDGAVEPAALRALIVAASQGARLFEVRPSLACCRGSERPAVTLSYRGFPRHVAGPLAAACHVGVYDERGNSLSQSDVEVAGTEEAATGSADLDSVLPSHLGPGLYRIEAVLTLPGEPPLELRHTTGFWVWDPVLLAGGAPLGRGEYALTRNGEPYVVTGTTYMASDVHRKFLLQPNPWLWDRDFAAMKRAGVNLVRTGIWTGWRSLMPRVGEFDQAALRSLDAFLLTARRYDIPVVFTYFAFLPETWGGENAYLDPAALEAQRAFVTAIAGRYGTMNDLAHDLINEPSFCNRDHLWSCRPNFDRFERAAWAAWISERWDVAARTGSSLDLPRLEEFGEEGGAAATDHATPKVLEYRLFAQATFAHWVRGMAAAIRANGAARQLVTVGQDEAGTRDSPNNLFLGPDLDFTTNHTWWLNDALVWDGVITKVQGKVNLIEETGVMFSGRPAGVDSRWEEYARNLLERKMAVAVGPGGAGFVEWVWNSNCYMPSDNEAAIGLLRADGAAKPELAALRGVAEFVAAAQRHLVGREDERVLMVVPHSNMFSVRNTSTDATKMAVRVMQYRCRVGMAAVSEYAVTPAMRAPRLVVVPAPLVLRQDAWEGLLAWARRGSLVLVTGPIDRDEHGNRVERLERLGIRGPDVAAVVQRTIPLGLGAVLWSPQPAESSSDPEATAVLYRWALGQAGIEPAFSVDGADASILVHAAAYQSCVLFTLVSENPRAVTVHLYHRESHQGFDVVLPPERAALLLVGRADGRLIGSYQPV
jgi:hypothetical protein